MHNKKRMVSLKEDVYDWKYMSLMEYIDEGNIPTGWDEFFNQDDIQNELHMISNYLKDENSNRIYPLINQVYRAFYDTPLNKVTCVLLGQDPYHNGSAMGLCFSVKHGNVINPSLKNIYKELKNSGFMPTESGDLTHWAKQGVLMLNTALTVEKNCAESHTAIWYPFAEQIIKYISKHTNVDWILLGRKAHAFEKYISQGTIHKASHPSPLSAYSSTRFAPSFFGSNIFKKIDIDW